MRTLAAHSCNHLAGAGVVARLEQYLARHRQLADETANNASECPPVVTAWAALPRRRLHEWLGVAAPREQPWSPPLAVLSDAGRRALDATNDAGPARDAINQDVGVAGPTNDLSNGLAIWIGRAVWPYPSALPLAALDRCLMVAARNADERLWAMEIALQHPGVSVVVADGRGLPLTATRRLQLRAEASRALVMLARPPTDEAERSAAAYRWRVTPEYSPTMAPRWLVELIRCKDAAERQGCFMERRWSVEWRYDAGLVTAPSRVVGRSLATAQQAT